MSDPRHNKPTDNAENIIRAYPVMQRTGAVQLYIRETKRKRKQNTSQHAVSYHTFTFSSNNRSIKNAVHTHTTLPNRHPHHATKSTSTPRYQIHMHTTLPNPLPHHATKSTSTPRYQIHIHTALPNPHPEHATMSTSTPRYQIHIHNTLPNPHPQHAVASLHCRVCT